MGMMDFDSAGTRDGNVSGRLLNFLGRLRTHSSDRMDDALPQRRGAKRKAKGKGRSARARSPSGSIDSFVDYWDLDDSVAAYLESMEDDDVLDVVLGDFDPSGSKDGDVVGRLKAFVLSTMIRLGRGAKRRPDRRSS